ncbi:MAG TPA: SPOR domain-containing protein [Vicinamibacterales bacterium]|nr:SPOR domain-containing protein [Vicinamibacterales bacterium]
MSDQGFREVQLGGKQVVFLFMALAVVLVGTFLLGVSVGRHVEPETANAQATPTPTTATDVNASGPMPPPTTTAPGDIRYPETLRGKPEPVVPAPAATPEAAPPEQKSTPAPATRPATPPPGEAWYVQVDSFSSSANAAKRVSELKAKGITDVKSVKSGTHYQVRVGPFDRQNADAMDARLRKLGYKPRVTR